jgi:hypothetical protein
MRKALSQLDDAQREAPLYLTDVSLAAFSAAFVVSILQGISEFVLG